MRPPASNVKPPTTSHPRDSLFHDQFGDLTSKTAVTLPPERDAPSFLYQEKQPALIHLSVTGRCYARCRGCINASITASFPGERREIVPIRDTEPQRDATCIINLLRQSGKETATICFYGGEPLLALDKITAIVERLDNAPLRQEIAYMVYTNGDLLARAVAGHAGLMRAIRLFSVSIDGRPDQHNWARPGTDLDKIHTGLEALATVRTGRVLVWSTLREEQSLADCFAEFIFLFDQEHADLFFWHWVETAKPFTDFAAYARGYENDLREIMRTYLDRLEQGRILPLIHITELVLYLLSGRRRTGSACGVELDRNYDLIDGKIHSCADLPLEMAIGRIEDNGTPRFNNSRRQLSRLVAYKEELGCGQCGVHGYCGGRCPVQAYASSPKRLSQYCQLMRLHVGTVSSFMEQIRAAMAHQSISAQQLYDQVACYAQFTDVTP